MEGEEGEGDKIADAKCHSNKKGCKCKRRELPEKNAVAKCHSNKTGCKCVHKEQGGAADAKKAN